MRAARAQAFSLLAIATSYIGFVLGLSDFLADYLKARGAPAGPCRTHPPCLSACEPAP